MNSKIVSVVFIVLLISLFVGCVFPYPNFYSSNFIYANDQQIINDKYEDENHNVESPYDSVEVLSYDWFEFMDKHFTKYVTIRVIDIYSEREYFVQRFGGYNHADVQTIDKTNTAIFKEIYGGEWSWVRRPVWVEIDGQFFAGSTNGMPHGFSILDNGEGGHTCIHFLNSKTHGTKRVDEQHQACVKYATENKALLIEYHKEHDNLKNIR